MSSKEEENRHQSKGNSNFCPWEVRLGNVEFIETIYACIYICIFKVLQILNGPHILNISAQLSLGESLEKSCPFVLKNKINKIK